MDLKDLLDGKIEDMGTIFEITQTKKKIKVAATGPTTIILEGIAHYLVGIAEGSEVPVELIILHLIHIIQHSETETDERTIIKMEL
jgi:hypothetical protein